MYKPLSGLAQHLSPRHGIRPKGMDIEREPVAEQVVLLDERADPAALEI